jgi:uncharacterized membrane protein
VELIAAPLRAYLAALLVIGALDLLWLGLLAREFYQRELGDLAAAEVRKLPALLVYLLYPAALVLLAVWPTSDTLASAIWRAGLLGLAAYGAYDLTNMATLRHWSVPMAIVDIGWGTFISACAGAAAHQAVHRL